MLLSEEFVAENRIFQKMTALSFSVEATTQSVVVKLESPSQSFFQKPYIHEKIGSTELFVCLVQAFEIKCQYGYNYIQEVKFPSCWKSPS